MRKLSRSSGKMRRSILTYGLCTQGPRLFLQTENTLYRCAFKEMKRAIAAAPDNQKTYLNGLLSQLESKHDINK